MRGIAFLHSQTITSSDGKTKPMIHGNLTSKNVLFSGSTAKLTDFGLEGQGLLSQFKPVLWINEGISVFRPVVGDFVIY